MAKIDYYALEENLAEILRNNITSIEPHAIVIEEPPDAIGLESNPSVCIMIEGRAVPEELQTIAAHTRTTYHVEVVMIVEAFDLQGFKRACELRDDVIGDIEHVLQDQDNWNSYSAIECILLDGGKLETVKDEKGTYYAGGEIRFRIETTATL